MDVIINVSNQKLKMASNIKSFISGTQEFIRFQFILTDDWDGVVTFAQFTQDGVSYNQYLDDEDSVYLPAEITSGECTLMLYGTGDPVIATTNYLTLTIDENILVADARSTEITESLYQQLVAMINNWDVSEETVAWLEEHISTTELPLDSSLKVEGAAADAKAAGLLIIGQDEQPTEQCNHLWIDTDSTDEVELATYEELCEIKVITGEITLSSTWNNGGNNVYSQAITIPNVTENSKIDLQPNATVLSQMISDEVSAIWAVNNSGNVTAYALNSAPSVALTMQYSKTEVNV